MSEKEIVRSTRGLKKRKIAGKKGLVKKLSICLSSFICAISFIVVGAMASLTNVSVDIDNDIYYYATAFNKNDQGYFIIEDYNDLVTLSNLVNNDKIVPDTDGFKYSQASFVIVKDILAPEGTNFTPIGTNSFPFKGVIYGNKWDASGNYTGVGVTISNITINSSAVGAMYAGLFGYVDGATIQNIGLKDDCVIDAGHIAYVGGIVGSAVSTSGTVLIENCFNYATINGGYNIGGIVGSINGNTIIKNCYNTGRIVAENTNASKEVNAGGIIGLVSGTNNVINGVYNIGEIDATATSIANVSTNARTTGGLVGNPKTATAGLTITNAYFLNSCLVDEQGNTVVGTTGGLGTALEIPFMSDIDALSASGKMTGLAGLKYTDKLTLTEKTAWVSKNDTTDRYFFPQLAVFNPNDEDNNTPIANNGSDWFNKPKNYAITYFANGGVWRGDILEDTIDYQGTPGGGTLNGDVLVDYYNASREYELFHNTSSVTNATSYVGFVQENDFTREGYVFAGWIECDENGNFLTGDNTLINGAGFYTNDAGYDYAIKASSYGNVFVKANWVKVGQEKGEDKAITYGDNTTEELQIDVSIGDAVGSGIVAEAGYYKIIYKWYRASAKNNFNGTLVETNIVNRAGSSITSASFASSDTIVPNDYLKGSVNYAPVGTYYFYCEVIFERVYDSDGENRVSDEPIYGTATNAVRNNGSTTLLRSDMYTFTVNQANLVTPNPTWLIEKATDKYTTKVQWTNNYNTPAIGDVGVQKYVVKLYNASGNVISTKEVNHSNKSSLATYTVDFTSEIETNEAGTSTTKGTYYVTVEIVPSTTNNASNVNVAGGVGETLKLYTVTYNLNNTLIKMYDDANYTIENTIKRRYTIDGEGVAVYFKTVDGFLMPENDDTTVSINSSSYDALVVKNNGSALDGLVASGSPKYTYRRSANSDNGYFTNASLVIADSVGGVNITGAVEISIYAVAHTGVVLGHSQNSNATHEGEAGKIIINGFYHSDNDGYANYNDNGFNLKSNESESNCPETCAEILATYSISDRNGDIAKDNVITFTAEAFDGYIFLGFFKNYNTTSEISNAISGNTSGIGTMSGSVKMTMQEYMAHVGTGGLYARFEANEVDITVTLDGNQYTGLEVKLVGTGSVSDKTYTLTDEGNGVYSAVAIHNGTYQIWTTGRQGNGTKLASSFTGISIVVNNNGSSSNNSITYATGYTNNTKTATKTVEYYSLYMINGLIGLSSTNPNVSVLGGFSSSSYLYDRLVVESGIDVEGGNTSYISSTVGTIYIKTTSSSHTFRDWDLVTTTKTEYSTETETATIQSVTNATTTIYGFSASTTLYANYASTVTLEYGFTSGNELKVVTNPSTGYTYTYQWFVGGSSIYPVGGSAVSGATASTYNLPRSYSSNGSFVQSGSKPNYNWLNVGTYYYYVVVTATRTGDGTLGYEYIGSVQVVITEETFETPSGLVWESNNKTTAVAKWDKVDTIGAVAVDHYVVNLYKGTTLVSTVETVNTSYDFASTINANGKGNYRFTVQAIASTTNNAGKVNVKDSAVSSYSGYLYTVTYTLSNVVEDNGIKYVVAGTQYSSSFTANSGYIMPDTITVKVNGGIISSYTYKKPGNGKSTEQYADLTIGSSAITGYIEIAIAGEANRVAVQVNKDGNVYTGLTVTLRQSGTIKYTLTYNSTTKLYEGEAIANGTYDIWTTGRRGVVTSGGDETTLLSDSNVNITIGNNGSDEVTATINYYSLYVNTGLNGNESTVSGIVSNCGFSDVGTYPYVSLVIEESGTACIKTTNSGSNTRIFRTWGITNASGNNASISTEESATTTISGFNKSTTIYASYGMEFRYYYGFTTTETLSVAQTLVNGSASSYQWYMVMTLNSSPLPTGGVKLTGATSATYTLPNNYPNTWIPAGTYQFYCAVTTTVGTEYIGSTTVIIEQEQFETPSGLVWESDNKTTAVAKWDETETIGVVSVDHYVVKLYKGTTLITTKTTTSTSYDFASVINTNGKGNYRFTVQAIASTTNNADKVNVKDSEVSSYSGYLYTVTYTLSNVVEDNGIKYIVSGTQYSSSFTANSGYIMPDTITVKVNGTATTSYTYKKPGNGKSTEQYADLTIGSSVITGYIEIAIAGEPNRVAVQVNKDGSNYTGLTVTLRQGGTIKYTLTYNSTTKLYEGEAIVNGTYDVWTTGRRGVATKGGAETTLTADSGVDIVIGNNGDDAVEEIINYYSLYVNTGLNGNESSISGLVSNCGFSDVGTYPYVSLVIEESGTACIKTTNSGADTRIFRTWGITNSSGNNASISTEESATTTISGFNKSTTIYASYGMEFGYYYGFTTTNTLRVAETFVNGSASSYQWYVVIGGSSVLPTGGYKISGATAVSYTLPKNYSATSYTISGSNITLNWLPAGSYHFYCVVTTSVGSENIGATTVTVEQKSLDTPSGLVWESNNKTTAVAKWNAVGAIGAVSVDHYVVKLYKGTTLVSTVETVNTSYDFASVINTNGKGNYRFTVQAIASTTNNADKVNVKDSAVSSYSGYLYTVTYTLSNVVEDNGIKYVVAGTQYSSSFTANSGYILPDAITVKVNGTATTSYTYTIPASGKSTKQYADLTIGSSVITGYIEISIAGEPNRVSIQVLKDGSNYTGLTVTLRQSGTIKYTLTYNSTTKLYEGEAIVNGTYDVWTTGRRGVTTKGGAETTLTADSGVNIVIGNNGSDTASETINYYSLYVNTGLNGNESTISGLVSNCGFTNTSYTYVSLVIEESGTAYIKTTNSGSNTRIFRTWGITNSSGNNASISSVTNTSTSISGFNKATTIYASYGMAFGYTYGFTSTNTLRVAQTLVNGSASSYQWYVVIGGSSVLPTGGYKITNNGTSSTYTLPKNYGATSYTISGSNITLNWLPAGSYHFYCVVTTSVGSENIGATTVTIGKASLSDPSNLYFDDGVGTDGQDYKTAIARWTAVNGVGAVGVLNYKVMLYKNGELVNSNGYTATTNYYDFSSVIDQNGQGNYYFTVQAVATTTSNASYVNVNQLSGVVSSAGVSNGNLYTITFDLSELTSDGVKYIASSHSLSTVITANSGFLASGFMAVTSNGGALTRTTNYTYTLNAGITSATTGTLAVTSGISGFITIKSYANLSITGHTQVYTNSCSSTAGKITLSGKYYNANGVLTDSSSTSDCSGTHAGILHTTDTNYSITASLSQIVAGYTFVGYFNSQTNTTAISTDSTKVFASYSELISASANKVIWGRFEPNDAEVTIYLDAEEYDHEDLEVYFYQNGTRVLTGTKASAGVYQFTVIPSGTYQIWTNGRQEDGVLQAPSYSGVDITISNNGSNEITQAVTYWTAEAKKNTTQNTSTTSDETSMSSSNMAYIGLDASDITHSSVVVEYNGTAYINAIPYSEYSEDKMMYRFVNWSKSYDTNLTVSGVSIATPNIASSSSASTSAVIKAKSEITANFIQRVTVVVELDLVDVYHTSYPSIAVSDGSLSATLNKDALSSTITFTYDYSAGGTKSLTLTLSYSSGSFNMVWGGSAATNTVSASGAVLTLSDLTRSHSAKNPNAETEGYAPYVVKLTELFDVNFLNVYGSGTTYVAGDNGGQGRVRGIDEAGIRTTGVSSYVSYVEDTHYTSLKLMYNATYKFNRLPVDDFEHAGWYAYDTARTIGNNGSVQNLGITQSSTASIQAFAEDIVWDEDWADKFYIYSIFVKNVEVIGHSQFATSSDCSITGGNITVSGIPHFENGWLGNSSSMTSKSNKVSGALDCENAKINVGNMNTITFRASAESGYTFVGFFTSSSALTKLDSSTTYTLDGVEYSINVLDDGMTITMSTIVYESLQNEGMSNGIWARFVTTPSVICGHAQVSTGAHSSDGGTIEVSARYYNLETGKFISNNSVSECDESCATIYANETITFIAYNKTGYQFVGFYSLQGATSPCAEWTSGSTMMTLTLAQYNAYASQEGFDGIYARFVNIGNVVMGHTQIENGDHTSEPGSVTLSGNGYNSYGVVASLSSTSDCSSGSEEGCACIVCVETATITFSVSTTNSGYTFVGWFPSQTSTSKIPGSTSISMSYDDYVSYMNSNSENTPGIYARFIKNSDYPDVNLNLHTEVDKTHSGVGGSASVWGYQYVDANGIRRTQTTEQTTSCKTGCVAVNSSFIESTFLFRVSPNEGYVFVGWYPDETSDDLISSDMDLVLEYDQWSGAEAVSAEDGAVNVTLNGTLYARFKQQTEEITIEDIAYFDGNIIKDTDVNITEALIGANTDTHYKMIDVTVVNSRSGEEVHSGDLVPVGDNLTISYTINLPFASTLPGAIYAKSGSDMIVPTYSTSSSSSSGQTYIKVGSNGTNITCTKNSLTDEYELSAPMIVAGKTYVSVFNDADIFSVLVAHSGASTSIVVYPNVCAYSSNFGEDQIGVVQRTVSSGSSSPVDFTYASDNTDSVALSNVSSLVTNSSYYLYGWSTAGNTELAYGTEAEFSLTNESYFSREVDAAYEAKFEADEEKTECYTRVANIYAIWNRLVNIKYKDDEDVEILNSKSFSSVQVGALYNYTQGTGDKTISVTETTTIWDSDTQLGVHFGNFGYTYLGVTANINAYSKNSTTDTQTSAYSDTMSYATSVASTSKEKNVYVCCSKLLRVRYIGDPNYSGQAQSLEMSQTYYFYTLKKGDAWEVTADDVPTNINPITSGAWDFVGLSSADGHGPNTSSPAIYGSNEGSKTADLSTTETETKVYAVYRANDVGYTFAKAGIYGAYALTIDGHLYPYGEEASFVNDLYFSPSDDSANVEWSFSLPEKTEFVWKTEDTPYEFILHGFNTEYSAYDATYFLNTEHKVDLYKQCNNLSLKLYAKFRSVTVNNVVETSGAGSIPMYLQDGDIIIRNFRQTSGVDNTKIVVAENLSTIKFNNNASTIEFEYSKLDSATRNYYLKIGLKVGAGTNATIATKIKSATSGDWQGCMGILKNTYNTSTYAVSVSYTGDGESEYFFFLPVYALNNGRYKLELSCTWYMDVTISVISTTIAYNSSNLSGLTATSPASTLIDAISSSATINDLKFSSAPVVFDNDTKEFSWVKQKNTGANNTGLTHKMEFTIPYKMADGGKVISFNFSKSTFSGGTITVSGPTASGTNEEVTFSTASAWFTTVERGILFKSFGTYTITWTANTSDINFSIEYYTSSTNGKLGNLFANAEILGIGSKLELYTFRKQSTYMFTSWDYKDKSGANIKMTGPEPDLNMTFSGDNAEDALREIIGSVPYTATIVANYKVTANPANITFVAWDENYSTDYDIQNVGATLNSNYLNKTFTLKQNDPKLYSGSVAYSYPVPAVNNSMLVFIGWFTSYKQVSSLADLTDGLVVSPNGGTTGSDVIRSIENYTTLSGWDSDHNKEIVLYARYVEVYEISLYHNNGVQTYDNRVGNSIYTIYEYYNVGYYSQKPSHNISNTYYVGNISNYEVTQVTKPERSGYTFKDYRVSVSGEIKTIFGSDGKIATSDSTIFRTDAVITAFWEPTSTNSILNISFSNVSNIENYTPTISWALNDNDQYSMLGNSESYVYDWRTSTFTGYSVVGGVDKYVYIKDDYSSYQTQYNHHNMADRIIVIAGTSGYVFNGWYTSRYGGQLVIDTNGVLMPSVVDNGKTYTTSDGKWSLSTTNSITLYPHFAADEIEVVYRVNEGAKNTIAWIYGNHTGGIWDPNQTTLAHITDIITTLSTPYETLKISTESTSKNKAVFGFWEITYQEGDEEKSIIDYRNVIDDFKIVKGWSNIVVTAWYEDDPLPEKFLVRMDLGGSAHKYFPNLSDAIDYANDYSTTQAISLVMLGDTSVAHEGVSTLTIKRPMEITSDSGSYSIGSVGTLNEFYLEINSDTFSGTWGNSTGSKVILNNIKYFGQMYISSSSAIVSMTNVPFECSKINDETSSYGAIGNKGTLYISGSGKIESTYTSSLASGATIYNYQTGILEIDISNNVITRSHYGVLYNNGKATIKNGSFFASYNLADAKYHSALLTNTNTTEGNFVISGGTFCGDSILIFHYAGAYVLSNYGYAKITGGTFRGGSTNGIYSTGNLVINGGSIESNGTYAVNFAGGIRNKIGSSDVNSTARITGGLEAAVYISSGVTLGSIYMASSGAKISSTSGHAIHNAGKITNINYVTATTSASGKSAFYNTGTVTGSIYAGTITNTAKSAGSGVTSAVHNTSSTTLTFKTFTYGDLKIASASGYSVYNASGASLVLSAHASNYSSYLQVYGATTYYLVYNLGTLEISAGQFFPNASASSAATPTASHCVYNGSSSVNATCTISGGDFYTTTNRCIVNNGTMTISGGTINGGDKVAVINGTSNTITCALTISGGTISATSTSPTIYNNTKGTITISGGTITASSKFVIYNNGAVYQNAGDITGTDGVAIQNNANASYTAGGGTITVNNGANTKTAIVNNGTFTLSGTEITIYGSNGINNSKTLEVFGGSIVIASGIPNYCINVGETAYFYMTSGTIDGSGAVHVVMNSTTLTQESTTTGGFYLSGGTITSSVRTTTEYIIYNFAGAKAMQTGGTVTGKASMSIVYLNGGSYYLRGGTISGEVDDAIVYIYGASGANFHLVGGTIDATNATCAVLTSYEGVLTLSSGKMIGGDYHINNTLGDINILPGAHANMTYNQTTNPSGYYSASNPLKIVFGAYDNDGEEIAHSTSSAELDLWLNNTPIETYDDFICLVGSNRRLIRTPNGSASVYALVTTFDNATNLSVTVVNDLDDGWYYKSVQFEIIFTQSSKDTGMETVKTHWHSYEDEAFGLANSVSGEIWSFTWQYITSCTVNVYVDEVYFEDIKVQYKHLEQSSYTTCNTWSHVETVPTSDTTGWYKTTVVDIDNSNLEIQNDAIYIRLWD